MKPVPAFPGLEAWLASGGDLRIACDPERGRNRYGCLPAPEPGVLAYGSVTASTISSAGFAAALALRDRLERAAADEAPSATYAREADRLRRELAACWGLEADAEIAFGASGTDLHLFLSQLLAEERGLPTAVFRSRPSETGRGVPRALEGRHFDARAALQAEVVPGEPIPGARPVEVREIPDDGNLDAAARAASAGHRVVVVLTDVSKTGRVTPHPDAVLALRDRFPEAVTVVVDACQLRLAPATLRAYLRHGFVVAVTGSKFATGPAFCGAVVAAGAAARRLRDRSAPAGLGGYLCRADVPEGWAARRALPEAANYGLLLRWEAALAEMRPFYRLPEGEVAAFLGAFARAVSGGLAGDPAFAPLAAAAPDRGSVGAADGWDRVPTIFPFLLRSPAAGGGWLDRGQAVRVGELLRADLWGAGVPPRALSVRCEVGQPVDCAARDGRPAGALRLCAGMRLAVEALAPGGRGAAAVIDDALAVLEKAAFLASRTD